MMIRFKEQNGIYETAISTGTAQASRNLARITQVANETLFTY